MILLLPNSPSVEEAVFKFVEQRANARSDYAPITPILRQAIANKCSALGHLSPSDQLEKMLKFAEQVLCVLNCVWDGAFNQVDVQDAAALMSLIKRATQRRVRTGQLKPSSAATYVNCWIEVMGAGSPKSFVLRDKAERHATYVSQATFERAQENDDEEIVAEHDGAWKAQVEQDQRRYRSGNEKLPSKRRYSRHFQVLEYNASPYQQNAFSLASLAMLFSLTEQRARELPEAQGKALRCLMTLSLTTGRLITELADLSIVDDPTQSSPGISLNDGMLCCRPDYFVGHPARITNALTENGGAEYMDSDWHLPIRAVVVIPVAEPALRILRDLHHQTHCQKLSEVLAHARIRDEMAKLNLLLHDHLPNAAKCTEARLALSFNARYAELDPIYCYYVQGRALPPLHLPLRYTRVSAARLAHVYGDHTTQVLSDLAETSLMLARTRPMPPAEWLAAASSPTTLLNLDAYWGSWRCANSEKIHIMLDVLHRQHLLLYTLVALCAFTGLRPFEPLTLQPHQLSEDGSQLAVRGKPNIAHPAHRVIPVPLCLRPLLLALQRENNTWLFQKDDGGRFELHEVETAILGLMHEHGHSLAPDLYSLRHAYRSALLAGGVPFPESNYLMGHQTEGCCIYDPYLDRPAQPLGSLIAPVVRTLERAYGLCLHHTNVA